jgi:hypothetical protein
MRTIELTWNCKDCETTNILGREKQCPNCGSPREKGEMNMSGLDESDYDSSGMNKAKTVSDSSLLNLANAGEDWFCTHCTSGNIGNGDKCNSCGARRYGIKAEDLYTASSIDFTPPVSPPLLSSPSPVQKQTSEYSPPPPPPEQSSQKSTSGCATVAIIATVVIATLSIIWCFMSHDVNGNLSEMNWKRTASIQEWKTVTKSAWQHKTTEISEIKPVNGAGERAGLDLVEGSCNDAHYEDERYQCGTKEETYDCSYSESYTDTCKEQESYKCGETCKNSGNGFAKCTTKYCTRTVSKRCTKTRRISKTCNRTVPKYCTRPIYKKKCDYITQEWMTIRTPTITGSGKKDLTWPDSDLSTLQRSQRSAEYTLTISYFDDNEAQSFVEKVDESTFLSWNVNDNVRLKITNIGTVSSWSK